MLMDGSHLEIPREEALELLPFRKNILISPHLKSPAEGLLCYRGKLVPVLGPLPEPGAGGSVDDRPWILLMNGRAQVIQGLPDFQEGESKTVESITSLEDEESALLSELDELLKAA